jgi:hypothetical protein
LPEIGRLAVVIASIASWLPAGSLTPGIVTCSLLTWSESPI